jgi:phosphatidylserine/phosphatidylglycerophosphate/cardiolipin synthase-like enzyme
MFFDRKWAQFKSFSILVTLAVASSHGFSGFMNTTHAETRVDSRSSSEVQLVQSVPEDTSLAQPGIAFTADVWLKMIRESKLSIDLAQFYVSSVFTPPSGSEPVQKSPKKSLEPILLELERAAQRGVKIRILISDSLQNEDKVTLDRLKRMRGASLRIYDMSSLTGGVHHAKYWVVDRKTVFMGSQNFDWRSLSQIHELGVKIEDKKIAGQMSRLFELDWKTSKTKERPLPLSSEPDQLYNDRKIEILMSPENFLPRDTRAGIRGLLGLIQKSKQTIRIQLLDYSPLYGTQGYWPVLDNALRAAAARGVKIEMMVAHCPTSIKSMDALQSLGSIRGISVKVVSIPAHLSGPIPHARVIHSKYMVVDDEILWLGSSNWGRGYFYNSRNVDAIFNYESISQSATEIFQRLWNSQYAQS